MSDISITNHACKRFRERVRETPEPRGEIRQCLMSANKSHMNRAMRKDSWHVPVGCCVLVFNKGAVVTVLPMAPELIPMKKPKSATTTPAKPTTCHFCGAELPNGAAYRKHVQSEHGDALGPVVEEA